MLKINKTIKFPKIISKIRSLKLLNKSKFSSSKAFFKSDEMKSQDFLESLHIPKTEEDIQVQLDVLGK